MNTINISIDFKNGTNRVAGIDLITGDYASTKIKFTFDRADGTKVFEMKNPSGDIVYVGEIENNEVVLAGEVDGSVASIFNEPGEYIYEVSLYSGDSKLSSCYGKLPVKQEQVIVGDEVVTPYLPVFDELLSDVSNMLSDMETALEEAQTAITEANNLDLDVTKVDKTATITLTKKDATTKVVTLSDGTSLMFNWDGTKLGIKTDSEQDYTYVDLQGTQGETGPMGSPFTIAKTYSTEAQMIADYDNMQVGDYVMIDGDIELQENATLWVKEETPAPTTKWHYLADFSGASGIQGETGATPNIQIGSVTSGATPSVTRTGTNENPILNFVLQKGDKGATGETGATGATGNGISNIAKTSTSGLVDTYTITYTNGTTTTYEVTNGEDGEVTQAQLDEVQAELDRYKMLENALPKVTGTGESITLDNTANAGMKMSLSPSDTTQETTTGKNKLNNTLLTTETTQNGVTLTPHYTNGMLDYINLNGTATSVIYANLSRQDFGDGSIISGGVSTDYTASIGASVTGLGMEYSGTNKYTYIRINQSVSLNNIKIYPMMRLSSVTDDTYEPYCGGIPAPNPSYPIDVNVVKGDNVILERGINLINIQKIVKGRLDNGVLGYASDTTNLTLENDSFSFTTNTYWRGATTDYIEVDENTDYMFNSSLELNSATNGLIIASYDKNKNFISNISQVSIDNHKRKITIPSNAKYIRVNIQIKEAGTATISNPQLEKGSTATNYEHFIGNNYELNLGVRNIATTYSISGSGYINWSFDNSKATKKMTFSFVPNFTINNATIYMRSNISGTLITLGVIPNLVNGEKASISFELTDAQLSEIKGTTGGYVQVYRINVEMTQNSISEVQLEEGTIAHSYSEYGVEPIKLCKINTYKDIFVKPSGKNKLEYTLASLKTLNTGGTWNNNVYTWNGVSFTINNNGTILVNGTASTTTSLVLKNGLDLVNGEQYILNGCPSGGNVSTYSLRIYTGNDYESDTGSGKSFTYGSQSLIRLNIFGNTSPSNLLFKPMIRLASVSDDSYEPYNNNKWYIKKNMYKELVKPTSCNLEENGVRTNFTLSYLPVSSYPELYCNYFRRATSYAEAVGNASDSKNKIGFNTSGLCLCNIDGYTTQTEYIDFFTNNDVYVIYLLASPQYTLCNDTLQTQLNNIKDKLLSYQNQTNISQVNNDRPFVIGASALKDLSNL